jgi:hypothetical protein
MVSAVTVSSLEHFGCGAVGVKTYNARISEYGKPTAQIKAVTYQSAKVTIQAEQRKYARHKEQSFQSKDIIRQINSVSVTRREANYSQDAEYHANHDNAYIPHPPEVGCVKASLTSINPVSKLIVCKACYPDIEQDLGDGDPVEVSVHKHSVVQGKKNCEKERLKHFQV